MADAESLIRDALHAFQNIGPGSADANKYTRRATRIAQRVINNYPTSIEAAQARAILDQLNVSCETASPAVTQQIGTVLEQRLKEAGGDADWQDLLRRLMALPPGKKKLLFAVPVIMFLFPGALFILLGAVTFYATQVETLKKHAHLVLAALDKGDNRND